MAFSVDNNGNGYYTDPGDILRVYHLRIVGNYAGATPYVNIYSSDANNLTLNHQSLGRAYWVNGAPVSSESAPGTIAFYNYTAPVVLDEISMFSGVPPVISSVSVKGGNFILSGTNSTAGVTYCLWSSTNPALPVLNWTAEATNTFSGNSFSFTNPISPSAPKKFYLLQLR